MNLSQNAASQQAAALVGSYTNSGVLKIYDGAMPATPETAITTQNLLATVTLPSTAFTQSNGVMTANAISNVTISATGTAAWARLLKSDGTTPICDMLIAPSSGLSAWATNTAYTAGNQKTANGNTYQCTTSGTSATTGSGPSLKVPLINDGTAVWSYVDILLGTTSLVSGAQLQTSSFTFTVPSV